MRGRVLFVTVSLSALTVVGAASAQSSTVGPGVKPATTRNDRNSDVAEVVVTAQKRTQNIQHVGAAITAVGRDQIAVLRIQRAADIAAAVPGLSVENRSSDATPTFAIRGIGLDDYNPNNSSGTAVYIDGSYQTGPVFLSAPLFDIDRIEVLKGPQGTLYGKNATGGAVNIVSNGPTDVLAGNISAGYGRYDTVNLSGAISGPLAPGLTGRLAGVATYGGEGFQTDIDTGARYGAPRRYAARGMLKYDQGDFSSVLSVHGSFDNSIPSSFQNDFPGGLQPGEAPFDNGTTDASRVRVGAFRLFRNESIYGATLNSKYSLGFAEIESTLSYDHVSRLGSDNNDGFAAPGNDQTFDEHVSQFYEETRLSSSRPIFGVVDYIVGTSYSWQQFKGNDTSDYSELVDPNLSDVSPGRAVSTANFFQKPTSLGFFINTTSHVTDAFRIILGGRYSHDTAHLRGYDTLGGAAVGGATFDVIPPRDDAHQEDEYDYKLGLEYDVSSQALAYLTTATGTKSAIFALGTALSPEQWQYVRPERLTSYEAGLKLQLFQRRVSLNGAVFHYDYKDRQTSVLYIDANGIFTPSFVNIPKSRVNGAEADTTIRVTHDLTLTGNVTYLDTRITKTLTDFNGFAFLSPIPVGSPLAQSPRWSYSLGGNYQVQLSDAFIGKAQLNYHRSTKQLNAVSDSEGLFGPNSSLDGRISVTNIKGWQVGAWGRNLTNNNDITEANTGLLPGARTLYRREPITYGADVFYRF